MYVRLVSTRADRSFPPVPPLQWRKVSRRRIRSGALRLAQKLTFSLLFSVILEPAKEARRRDMYDGSVASLPSRPPAFIALQLGLPPRYSYSG